MSALSVGEGASVRRKIKKRKYSRKGCKECKRRKIKCDEQLPACLNCSRLKKTCVYISGCSFRGNDEEMTRLGAISLRTPEYTRNTLPQALTVKFYEPKQESSLPTGGKILGRGASTARTNSIGPSIHNLLSAPHDIYAGSVTSGSIGTIVTSGSRCSETVSSVPGTSVKSELSRPSSSMGHGSLDLLAVQMDPQIDASGLSASGINASSLSASNFNASGLNASGLNASGLNASGLNASGLNSSSLNASGLNSSGLNSSGLSFGVSEMQDFSNNVNVFLEDMYTCQPIEGIEFLASDFSIGYLSSGQSGDTQGHGHSHGHGPGQNINLTDQPPNEDENSGLQTLSSDKAEPHNSTVQSTDPTDPSPTDHKDYKDHTDHTDHTDLDETALGLNPEDFPLFPDSHTSGLAVPINEHLRLSNSALSEQCIAQSGLREPHTYYLRLLTNTDLSFHLFPFAPSMDSNGVVKLLLTYSAQCTHLLTALLAISAMFQFLRTSEKRHDVASHFYNMVCFRALSAAFTKHNYYDDSETFARSIEKLLLTVLVISTRFTATSSLQDSISNKPWKVHLKGAVDLLRRYSEMTRNSSKRGGLYMSSGLALAKCWFFAIEASAAMHTALGGTLSRASDWERSVGADLDPDVYSHAPKVDLESEYHIFVATGCIDKDTRAEYQRALERVTLICEIDQRVVFNLYWGFNSSLVRPVLAFVASTDTVKLRRLSRVPFRWTMHILGLLDISLQEKVVPEVCLRTFRIPCASRGHPEYRGHDKLSIPESCFVSRPNQLGNRVYYSWFDASHQFQGDYLSLRVMVSHNFLGLPRSHPDVQCLLRKVFDGAFFIGAKLSPQYELERHDVLIESANYYLSKRTFDIRCVMVHSLFRLVSGIAIEPDHFERLELYFMGLLKLGNGGSLKSMDMIERVKSSREANRQRLNGGVDDEVYDFFDSMNDIPFS